jgi:hypothetical protein
MVDGSRRTQVNPGLPEVVIIHEILDIIVFSLPTLDHLLRCYLI